MKTLANTKIIATLGPATNTKEKLMELINAGVDVFRLNFSHVNYVEYEKLIQYVIELNEEKDLTIGLLADLQGPKIRIGDVDGEGFNIEADDILVISGKKKTSNKKELYISYESLENDIKLGERIFINDGKIILEVIESNVKTGIRAKVLTGGFIKARKGVNFPDTDMQLPSLTRKDLIDLEFITKFPVNWIALSFVRTDSNVKDLKKFLKLHKHSAKIIAKIEKPEAVKNIKPILRVADGIMVARGDLGVEIPIEELPGVQRDLIETSIKRSKVAIVATQMMESMINNSSPTRAEVTDVANAVLQGADAVMLSEETAMGNFPSLVVETMNKIIIGAEKSFRPKKEIPKPEAKSETFESDIVCFNAAKIADELNAKAIIGLTISGYTAFKVSSFRPDASIFIFSKIRSILATLNIIRGVKGFYYDINSSTEETHRNLTRILKEKAYISEGDLVVHTSSMPVFEKQRTNLIRVARVE
ncbi:MAG: pyruvate kinase [Deltaproteobacteria bacterium]